MRRDDLAPYSDFFRRLLELIVGRVHPRLRVSVPGPGLPEKCFRQLAV